MWSYPVMLALISVGVAALERLFPARPAQRALRPGLLSDLVYLVFNGHYLGVAIAWVAARAIDPWLAGRFELDLASGWPLLVQAGVAVVGLDFVQWCVHNLLHRVPWLWRLHQVHHSVRDGEMDWIVAFRFHWAEVVVYKVFQYLPLALMGFAGEALWIHAVFGTLIGHLNHANLPWDYGPLRWVLNNPRMHLWHHDYHIPNRNFGIIFSAWDWIFRTAYLPDRPPERIGFPGEEAMPVGFLGRTFWPLVRRSRG